MSESAEHERALGAYKQELAKRLCAAYASMQLQISLQHAYKRYVEGNSIGEYWLSLAEQLIAQPPDSQPASKTPSDVH